MSNNNETPDAPLGSDPADTEEVIDPVGDMLGMQAELDQLREEKDKLYNQLARTQADFINSRKRIEAEFDSRMQYANQKLIEQMLPVVDNFERALALDPAKVSAADIHRGIELVADQLKKLLSSQALEEVSPRPGDDFDPNQHQALMQQPSDFDEGKVTMVMQKGYALKGRVIRPAQVAVSAPK
ncbi:MAG: nucleotide exchange factor GrpE [Tepidisphaeraceae bacterium]